MDTTYCERVCVRPYVCVRSEHVLQKGDNFIEK